MTAVGGMGYVNGDVGVGWVIGAKAVRAEREYPTLSHKARKNGPPSFCGYIQIYFWRPKR